MRFLSRTPPAALAPFVEHLWWFDGDLDDGKERVLPSGRGQLLVNLHEDEMRTYDASGRAVAERCRGATLAGASGAPVVIDTAEQRRIVGVSFRPGGAWPFLRMPVDAVGTGSVELGEIWGRPGEVVRERLLGARGACATLDALAAILIEQIARPPVTDRAVEHAIVALERGASVASIVESTGLAQRTLLRRFRERVGISPKRYARIRRFQRVLSVAGRGAPLDWARVAQDLGFADQAHLIHDFRAFAGISPTAYRAVAGMRNHVAI